MHSIQNLKPRASLDSTCPAGRLQAHPSVHSQKIQRRQVMGEPLISSAGNSRQPLALVSTRAGNFINQIVNADCLTILPKLSSRSVDFVLTDPPYLANYRDRSGRTVANDVSDAWLKPAFAEIYRVLKHNRFCVCFYGWPKVDRF